MSKLLKKDLLREDSSYQISQLGASIAVGSGVSQADFEAASMIGAANSALIPLVYNSNTAGVAMDNSNSYMFQSSTTDSWWFFLLTLPTNRGGLKLYVKDGVIEVNTADANDYVDNFTVDLMRDDARLNIISDGTNRTAQGTYTYTNVVADDASAYTSVSLAVLVRMAGGAGDFRMASPLLECYYDT